MKTLPEWLQAYGVSHRHPANIALHKICVPLIMFSLIGLLWYFPYGPVILLPALIFYARLGWKPFAIMLAAFLVSLKIVATMDNHGFPAWGHFVIFALAWVGQFIGHKIEGRRPSFFEDLQFLLVGPLWVLRESVWK